MAKKIDTKVAELVRELMRQPWVPMYVLEVTPSWEVIEHTPGYGESKVVYRAIDQYTAHNVAQALQNAHIAQRPPRPLEAWYPVYYRDIEAARQAAQTRRAAGQ